MSVNVCSRLTYSNHTAGCDDSIEKKLSQYVDATEPDFTRPHTRSFPREPRTMPGSDYIRSSGNTPSRVRVVASEFNMASEKGMPSGQGYSLGSQRQPPTYLKRLSPMTKPRSLAQSMLNEVKCDKVKIRLARLLLQKKLANAASGLQQGAFPAGGRNTLESLLKRQVMQLNGRGRKKTPSVWMAQQYKRLNDLKVLREAQKYREDLRRGLMTDAEFRRMIEREAAAFGEMCSRMNPKSVVDTVWTQKELQFQRGRHVSMGPTSNPQVQQEQQPEYQRSTIINQESLSGIWIPPTRCTQLPEVPLIVDDIDDRQLVAKEVNLCIKNLRSLLHFAKEVLILAESDFSFSSALVDHTPTDSYMVATSFDSEEKLEELHKEKLENHLKILRDHNATILHDVDACQIEETLEASIRRKSPEVQDMIRTSWSGLFDLVWIQLPHTGGTAKTNSVMIQRFLSTVGRVLKPNGLVFMTLYGMQVDHWKVSQHALAAEMSHVLKVPFNTTIYPAIWTRYNPKVGFSNGYFDILRHPCDTFVFAQNEFTCVSKLKPVDSKILGELLLVKINTIGDLAVADKRLLSDDVDPKFIRLIHQAKGWFREWYELLTKLPKMIQSLPLLDVRHGQQTVRDGHFCENTVYY